MALGLLYLSLVSLLLLVCDCETECAVDALGVSDCAVNATNLTDNGTEVLVQAELPPHRLAFLFLVLFWVTAWMLAMLKFTIDGSLPARFAQWGLLPEAFAATSPRALMHLLRLKNSPTPVILLQNSVTDDNAHILAKALVDYGVSAAIQAVELPSNPKLTSDGLRGVAAACIGEGMKVEELDLSYNPQLGDALVPVLVTAINSKASRITELKLAQCGFTLHGVEGLIAAAMKSKLKLLDLSLASLGGAADVIEKVTEVPLLEELLLRACNLGEDDARVLGENLPFTSIKILQLAGNNFGSGGLVALCASLPESLVEELGLEAIGVEFGCEGLSKLGEAYARRPLSLRLSGNAISAEEMQVFGRTLRSLARC